MTVHEMYFKGGLALKIGLFAKPPNQQIAEFIADSKNSSKIFHRELPEGLTNVTPPEWTDHPNVLNNHWVKVESDGTGSYIRTPKEKGRLEIDLQSGQAAEGTQSNPIDASSDPIAIAGQIKGTEGFYVFKVITWSP